MKKNSYKFSAFLVLLFSVQFAVAQVIPFQGRLYQDGQPVNGDVELIFSIQAVNWSETHSSVPVSEGLYSVELGKMDTLPKNLFYSVESQILNIKVNGTDLTPVKIYPSYTGNAFVQKVGTDSVNSVGFSSMVSGPGVDGANYFGSRINSSVDNGTNYGLELVAAGKNSNNTGLIAYTLNGRSISNSTELTDRSTYLTSQLSALYGATDVGGRAFQAQYTATGPGQGVGVAGYSGGEGENWGVWGRARSFSDSAQTAGYFQAFGDGTGDHFGIKAFANGPQSGRNIGVYGTASGSPNENYAAWFDGDVKINGKLLIDGNQPSAPANRFEIGGGISEWKTFDTGNGLSAQLNFFGAKRDSVILPGGASIGIKGWDAKNPRNGYVHVNDSISAIVKMEAITNDSTGESYGMLQLDSRFGKRFELNPSNLKFTDANNLPNVMIGNRKGFNHEGAMYLYDSLGLENLYLESRATGGRLQLVKRNPAGFVESGVVARSSGSNAGLYMYGMNPAQDGNSFLVDLYTYDADPNGNQYSKGYRRAGVDFYDNEGKRLAALGSARDETGNDPNGKSGLLFLWGTNSPNVELTGKRWENADLPMLQLFGNQPDSASNWYHGHVQLEVQSNGTDEWGFLSLKGNNGAQGIDMNGSNGDINSIGTITAQAVVETSDRRFKTNIAELDNSLQNVMNLRGVSFNWKDNSKASGSHIGLIAQEVEKIYPEFVHTLDDGTKAVNYSQMVAVLIESVKELNTKVEVLEEQNRKLSENLNAQAELSGEIALLKSMIMDLSDDAHQNIDKKSRETAETAMTDQYLNQ